MDKIVSAYIKATNKRRLYFEYTGLGINSKKEHRRKFNYQSICFSAAKGVALDSESDQLYQCRMQNNEDLEVHLGF